MNALKLGRQQLGSIMVQQSIEPEGGAIDPGYIRSRVDDWASRIVALYDDLSAWLPTGYRAERSQGVTMNEELMREFGVEPRQLPVLNVFEGDVWKAKVIPFGLWVIGSNGRLDVLVGHKRQIIVGSDRSEGEPIWRIANNDARSELKVLNQTSWSEALQ